MNCQCDRMMVVARSNMKVAILVKAGSSKPSHVEQGSNGAYTAYLRAKPQKGKANEELVTVLAKHFRVAKSTVVIRRGATSGHKIVEIIGLEAA